jgi:hypothetical protein
MVCFFSEIFRRPIVFFSIRIFFGVTPGAPGGQAGNGDSNGNNADNGDGAENGGIALRWFLPAPSGPRTAARRAFCLEAGAEYTRLFARDSFTAYGKPFLEAGWRF